MSAFPVEERRVRRDLYDYGEDFATYFIRVHSRLKYLSTAVRPEDQPLFDIWARFQAPHHRIRPSQAPLQRHVS